MGHERRSERDLIKSNDGAVEKIKKVMLMFVEKERRPADGSGKSNLC